MIKKLFKSILKSFTFALFAFIFFAFASPIQILAADFDVDCNSNSCTQTPSGAIFSETNVYPGWSVTKIVSGVNHSGQEAAFAVEEKNLVSTGGLSDILLITIKKSGAGSNIYEDNLTNFQNYGYLTLSNVSNSGSQDYDFTVKMQESADNKYQGLTTTFNLNLGFELVPLPSSNPSSSPGSPPPGSPGPSPLPSPASPSPTASGVVAGAATEEVLLESPLPSVEGIIASPPPQVQGEKTECLWWNYPWWLPLVIQALLTWIYYYWLKKKKVTVWWLPPVLIALLSQLIHEILGCWCTNSKWCPWYWLFNLIIFISLTSYYFYRRKKQSSDLTTN